MYNFILSNDLMNSDKALVSGSENGVGPAKASLHGLFDEPGSP